MKSTSPGVRRRQQRGEVAGVLDGRAARQPQRPAALVRDDHRERRLAEPRRAGEQDVVGRALLDARGVEQQLQLPAHLLLPDELGEGASGAARPRTRARPRIELGRRSGRSASSCHSTGSRAVPGRAAPASGAAAPAPMPRSRLGRHRRRASATASAATRSDQPRPTRAARTCRRRRRAPRHPVARARSCGDGELAGERDDDELRGLRADAATPGGTARRRRRPRPRRSGPAVSVESTPSADFGPTPVTPSQQLEDLAARRGSRTEERQRVLARR